MADQFETHVVWMSEDHMLPGRRYLVKVGATTVGATIDQPKYQVNVNTLEHVAASTLALNQIGVANLYLDRPIPFDPYTENRDTGGFIIIDRMTNGTVGAGLIHFALRRADNVHWQAIEVDRGAARLAQGPTTRRGLVHRALGCRASRPSRTSSSASCTPPADTPISSTATTCATVSTATWASPRQTGWRTSAGRRRWPRSMADAGLIVLVSLISPYRAERRMARDLVGETPFVEVYVDTPLDVAESRDRKGLYAKARRGEMPNFTGIDAPYEVPDEPELHITTAECTAEQAANAVLRLL